MSEIRWPPDRSIRLLDTCRVCKQAALIEYDEMCWECYGAFVTCDKCEGPIMTGQQLQEATAYNPDMNVCAACRGALPRGAA